MDKLIKQSIDSRRDAIKASSEIDAGAQAKIDSLFAEIEKLGESCKDVGEFETKFAKSPLNQKYLDLFTEIATNSATKTAAKGAVVGGVKSAAEQAITELGPTRAAVHQKVHDQAQEIPLVGDAMDAAQKAGYSGHLAKLFKKKG